MLWVRSMSLGGWKYYMHKPKSLHRDKCGKWMFFYSNPSFARKMCKRAVKEKVVAESKYRVRTRSGVACFYANYDDIETHIKVIEFFLANGLIRRTKSGRLYNIAFKLDPQTRNKEYGNDFIAHLRLSDFIDLETGEWI